MVMAPEQFPRRCVPHFASMLIEAFSYVKFVPLTPKKMRHKLHLGNRLIFLFVVRWPLLSLVVVCLSVAIEFPVLLFYGTSTFTDSTYYTFDNGDGRHDGKGQNGDGWHDNDNGRHNDGKGQQGDGQHNDGDER